MPFISLTRKQPDAAGRDCARLRLRPQMLESKVRSTTNIPKHGRYTKLACIQHEENRDASCAPQSLVDRSKLPQFLAARKSQLTFQRQAVLNQPRQLRRDWPLPAPPSQPAESEPVDPEIPAVTEPEPNPQPVVSIDPPPPAETGECPEAALPEAA
ncbi:MAG: hypothetical protein LLG20_07320 [Acidobacteriales bacterium]|nr:hypothetical protein [Terriglobales bacterium]